MQLQTHICYVQHFKKFREMYQLTMLDYFENHELLTCNQLAFRKHHSTLTASLKLVDDLLDNMNEKLINGACFFLSKQVF